MEDEINHKQSLLYSKGKNNQAILILHGFAVNIKQTDLLFDYFKAKDFTVFRPIMPGHDGTLEGLKSYGPKDWLETSRAALNKLSEEVDSIFILGISFGSNIGLSLCVEGNPKIKAVVIEEMPIFFSFKMAAVLHFVQPIYQLLGIEFISKNSHLWRKNNIQREESFAYIPVKVTGLIKKYINTKTKKDLAKLKIPIFVIQAKKSDLINNNRIAKYICKMVDKSQRKFFCVPINNHDLNVLDDEGKIIVLENIYKFIKGIKNV